MATTLSNEMLELIRNLATNKYDAAKRDAIVVCRNDVSVRNAQSVEYLLRLLQNNAASAFELPSAVKGLITVQDLTQYREKRYYVNEERVSIYTAIEQSMAAGEKLKALGIPYLNSTLLCGEPGTGKTEFGKYAAYRLSLPFAYVNFSQTIDSYLGKTSRNLQAIINFTKEHRCVLFLDELDCIGLKREGNSGAEGELARVTISLMQCLDELTDGQIIIAATNREDRLDPALVRRFQRTAKFSRYSEIENYQMAKAYLDDIDGLGYDGESLKNYIANGDIPQAHIIKHINEAIVKAVVTDTEIVL